MTAARPTATHNAPGNGMKTKTTLCLLEGEADTGWIQQYLNDHGRAERVVVAACSVFGRIAAERASIACTCFDEESWCVDHYANMDISKRMSLLWPEEIAHLVPAQALRFRCHSLSWLTEHLRTWNEGIHLL